MCPPISLLEGFIIFIPEVLPHNPGITFGHVTPKASRSACQATFEPLVPQPQALVVAGGDFRFLSFHSYDVPYSSSRDYALTTL